MPLKSRAGRVHSNPDGTTAASPRRIRKRRNSGDANNAVPPPQAEGVNPSRSASDDDDDGPGAAAALNHPAVRRALAAAAAGRGTPAPLFQQRSSAEDQQRRDEARAAVAAAVGDVFEPTNTSADAAPAATATAAPVVAATPAANAAPAAAAPVVASATSAARPPAATPASLRPPEPSPDETFARQQGEAVAAHTREKLSAENQRKAAGLYVRTGDGTLADDVIVATRMLREATSPAGEQAFTRWMADAPTAGTLLAAYNAALNRMEPATRREAELFMVELTGNLRNGRSTFGATSTLTKPVQRFVLQYPVQIAMIQGQMSEAASGVGLGDPERAAILHFVHGAIEHTRADLGLATWSMTTVADSLRVVGPSPFAADAQARANPGGAAAVAVAPADAPDNRRQRDAQQQLPPPPPPPQSQPQSHQQPRSDGPVHRRRRGNGNGNGNGGGGNGGDAKNAKSGDASGKAKPN